MLFIQFLIQEGIIMQNSIQIKGGMPLYGEVKISGSKNAMSAVLPALTLINSEEESVLGNVPDISDRRIHMNILEEIGLTTSYDKDTQTVHVKGKIQNNVLSEANVPKVRASSLFLGALLAMTGEVHMPFCGGDQIGVRPLDIHFYVFDKFNIETKVENGYIHCHANTWPLQNATIYLSYPSVGATENALMLASKACGTTYIYNAASEPEITDLAVALTKMGAKISGAGTPIIRVTGVQEFHPIHHEIIPDRLELCTYLFAFICTRGKGVIRGGIPEHCISVLHTLIDAGVDIEYDSECVVVDATKGDFKPIRIKTLPYPGIPTDVQPLLSVFAVLCNGNSIIHDTVYKERFQYVNEFMKMGVEITQLYDHLWISGPQKFTQAIVHGCDIRAASALVLAALCAQGDTTVNGWYHIQRGYENFEEKLLALGAQIARIEE